MCPHRIAVGDHVDYLATTIECLIVLSFRWDWRRQITISNVVSFSTTIIAGIVFPGIIVIIDIWSIGLLLFWYRISIVIRSLSKSDLLIRDLDIRIHLFAKYIFDCFTRFSLLLMVYVKVFEK